MLDMQSRLSRLVLFSARLRAYGAAFDRLAREAHREACYTPDAALVPSYVALAGRHEATATRY
ncbi:MAG: hypothetical protein WCG26_10700, partial [Chloroflexales bacterium]